MGLDNAFIIFIFIISSIQQLTMQAYICNTCGVQYNFSETVPAHCPICEDERQYVNPAGQSWTVLEQLNAKHKNVFEKVAPNVYGIYTTPAFAIGQRAHLITSPN